jgi:protein TonB
MEENGVLHPMSLTNPVHRQRFILVACVLLLHALALWALQTGLLQRFVEADREIVVPVEAISEQPMPAPVAPVKPAPANKEVPAPKQNAVTIPAPLLPNLAPVAVPAPQAIADATPAPSAPAGVQAGQPALAAPAQPLAALPVAAPPAAPKVELPSSTADYLHNPKPKYPRLSLSRNEQGKVILSVLVGPDGKVREVVVKSSSGFNLLDRAAREAVLEWTFVPGKRNGAPVEMSVDVPIPFQLTD